MPASPAPSRGTRLISRVLPVAVKLWLQTQLDDIGNLEFKIQATDRQVLSGNIPSIALAAQQAIYQGVAISQLEAQANDIDINIGQVLRGKPLRLQHPFPIEGTVVLKQTDLAASATNSVLATGLMEFWQTLFGDAGVAAEIRAHYGETALQSPKLPDDRSCLQIVGTDLVLSLVRSGYTDIRLRGGLNIEQGHVLKLTAPHWGIPTDSWRSSNALNEFCWNLGKHTHVRSLTIQDDCLICQCKLIVQP